MAHLIVKDRKLCMVNGRFVTSANGAPCVCGEDDPTEPIPCNTSDPLPAGCYLITINGQMKADCQAASGFGPYSRVDSASISIAFVIEYDGVVTPTTTTRTAPITMRIINYDQNDNEDESFFYCDASVTVRVGCRNGVWQYTINASAGSPCNNPAGVQYFNGTIFLGGSFSFGGATPIGTPQENQATNEFDCQYPVTGGMALMRRVGDCGDPPQYVYAVNCDGLQAITVDASTIVGENVVAEYQGALFNLTSDVSTEQPVGVVWVDRNCGDPDPQPGNLFQLCGTGSVPEFIRANVAGDVDFVTVRSFGPEYSVGSAKVCRDLYQSVYARVVDDNTAAPTLAAIPATQCANPYIVTVEAICRFVSGTDAGDPQDPNNPAITDPGIQRTLPIQDLSGYDIEREINAARQGGCCGSPTK